MEIKDSNIISTISHIHSQCAEFLRNKMNQKGLPDLASSHGYILFLLSKEQKLSMQEISKKINRDKSTTTVLVRKLENLGFVMTSVNPQDNRSKYAELTQSGKNWNRLTKEISDELKKTFFTNLEESEIIELEKLLAKISENF